MAKYPEEISSSFDNLENNTIECLHLQGVAPSSASESISDTTTKGPVNEARQETFKEVVAHVVNDLSSQAPQVAPAPFPRKKTSVPLEELSVQDHVILEKHRLGIWLAKFAAIMMGAIVMALLGSMIYLVFSSDSMPETGVLSSIFSNLNDILLAVLHAGNPP